MKKGQRSWRERIGSVGGDEEIRELLVEYAGIVHRARALALDQRSILSEIEFCRFPPETIIVALLQ